MIHSRSIINQALLAIGIICSLTSLSVAEERTLTPEQIEKLAQEGDLTGQEETKRPDNLPDLTKGNRIGEKKKGDTWSLGPTGIVGYMVGGYKGDQIQIQSVLKGSPAEGKLQWGDVILGINGKKFVAGEHLGYLIGNLIIEAEKEENAGVFKLQIWRDRNFVKRNGKKNIAGVDIEKLFNKARDDNSLYDWKSEDEQKQEAENQNYGEFPIDGYFTEVELELRVLPPYSDTSPYDCPKATRIIEDAWKVLEKRFVVDPEVRNSGRGGILEAIALVASGKPEHRKLVRDWVRSNHSPWRPPTEPIGAMFEPGYKGYKGYQSWHKGFNGLNCAIYYDATGDDFVLPALRKYAIETAMGQSGGGCWGHTFAYPSFNGGKLHGMNPGYGALNAAGNRCFFLVTLAQKLGIKHPEIDLAVRRAHRFFGSYVDKGAIPYGFHGAAATDDSNGKNTGVAFSMKILGDNHGAKYFAQMSTHASFTRRGGHGHDYHGNWSAWAATLCGPEGTIVTERNMRWRRTLCRMHDGAFVYHSPTGIHKTLRDPTATAVLHYAAPLKQTLITGKDADKSYWWSDNEMKQLMTSAIPQLNDSTLIKRAGKPWRERTTDEIFELLDFFKPKARGQYTAELGKRYQAGEKEILPRLAKLLESDEPRLRDSGCRGLAACGPDATLQYMSKVAKLLNDPKEFVRIQAMVTMSKASNSPDTQLAILNATVAERKDEMMSPNNFPAWVQNPLFGKKDSQLAESPFTAGCDEKLVQAALEKLLDLDPIGNRGFLRSRSGIWSKDTVVRLAGPLTFAAEEEQTNDQMFSGRNTVGQAILAKHGYHEAIQASGNYLRKKAVIPRDIRPRVTFKRALVDPDVIKKYPAACRELLAPMKLWLSDEPLAKVPNKRVGKEPITYANATDLISLIEAAKQSPPPVSIATDVERFFQARLAKADSDSARINLCREELKDHTRKTTFRQMAAMNYLVKTLGTDATGDLLPYVGHDYWRLREHGQKLATGLVSSGGAKHLIQAFAKADPETAAGILNVLAAGGAKSGLATAEQALRHEKPEVRQAAVQALFTLGGDEVLPKVFAFMSQATEREDLHGCEKTLLSRRDVPAHAARVRNEAIAMLPKSGPKLRQSLYWILSQLGGPESMAVFEKAADTANDAEFARIVNALSYSPDRAADKLMLSLVKRNLDTPLAQVAAREGVRRMVIGPDDIGNRPHKEQLDYAESLLNMLLDSSTITYLGRIRSGRSAYILQRVMRRGETATAAKAIIAATSDLSAAPAADRKLAESALIDTIEFIEVTQLRGGAMERLAKDPSGYKAYPMWKALSAQAGKNLLKLGNPEEDPLPEFNDLDLDL